MYKAKLLLIRFAKLLLNIIYVPFKLLKSQNKIVFISRQYDKPGTDFILIKEQIEEQNINIETVFLCKKLKNGFTNKLGYIYFIFKCMYHLATAKTCITDTYNIPISILNHKENLKIIQIWHAMRSN